MRSWTGGRLLDLMEACCQLNFAYGSRILAEILALFGQVVFGAVIIGAAVVLPRFIARAIEAGGGEGAVTRIGSPMFIGKLVRCPSAFRRGTPRFERPYLARSSHKRSGRRGVQRARGL